MLIMAIQNAGKVIFGDNFDFSENNGRVQADEKSGKV